jgi:hypothetical protein
MVLTGNLGGGPKPAVPVNGMGSLQPGSLAALGALGTNSGNFSGIPSVPLYDDNGNFDTGAASTALDAAKFNAGETDTRAKTAFAENAFGDLLGQFKTGAGGTAPGGAGFVPTQLADDTAYGQAKLGAAKQNVGENLQSSLKALDAIMSQRGITGSGIQGAEAGKLVAGAGENLDNANVSLLGDELSREQGVLGANATGANTYNQAQIDNALKARQQLVGLLGSFGINF